MKVLMVILTLLFAINQTFAQRIKITCKDKQTLYKSGKVSHEEIFSNSNQIFIISSLLDDMSDAEHDLLPTNIGIENLMINSLISSYNSAILQQKKLISNAGPNNLC